MSILDKKFKYKISIPGKLKREIQWEMEHNVSPRTYWLHSSVGGKTWRLNGIASGTECSLEFDGDDTNEFITETITYLLLKHS